MYVKKQDMYEKRAIKSGLQSDTEIEIISGLETGDEVALQPEEAAKRLEKK